MIIQGEYNRGTTFSFYMTPVCKVWTRCKNVVSILESEEALNFKAENKIYELLCWMGSLLLFQLLLLSNWLFWMLFEKEWKFANKYFCIIIIITIEVIV